MHKCNVQDLLTQIDDHWSPHIVAELNGQHVKLAKIQGEFVWHQHEHEDELFFVLQGNMTMELRDRRVELAPGDMFVVPRGVEHRPVAYEETHIMLMEPAGTLNTGDAQSELTVTNPKRLD